VTRDGWELLGPDHRAKCYRDVGLDGVPVVTVFVQGPNNAAVWNLPTPVKEPHMALIVPEFPGMSLSEQLHLRARILLAQGAEAPPDPEIEAETDAVGVEPLPRSVQRLLTSAAHRLAPEVRDRWQQDWHTDALWIEGRWARLRFALGVRLVSVPRLRRTNAAAERDLPRRA